MAKKRSYTDLALTCTAASEVFTQDLEPPADGDKKPAAKKPLARSSSLASDFQDSTASALTEDGKVDSVTEERSGTKKDGTPWTLYGIWVGGELHKTFSKTIVERARDAEAHRSDVSVMYEVGEYGRDVIDLVVHGEQPPEAPAETPRDPHGPPPPGDDDIPW
jgi:hypothetical protein